MCFGTKSYWIDLRLTRRVYTASASMKIYVIAALFVACVSAGIVKRQSDEFEEVSPLEIIDIPRGRVCFDGADGNYTEQICPESEQLCQTTIRIENDNTQVMKMCKQDKACYNNQESNLLNCVSDEAFFNKVQVCHFCCEGDNCNEEEDLFSLLIEVGQYREPEPPIDLQ